MVFYKNQKNLINLRVDQHLHLQKHQILVIKLIYSSIKDKMELMLLLEIFKKLLKVGDEFRVLKNEYQVSQHHKRVIE